jgi:hypothetical protein
MNEEGKGWEEEEDLKRMGIEEGIDQN